MNAPQKPRDAASLPGGGIAASESPSYPVDAPTMRIPGQLDLPGATCRRCGQLAWVHMGDLVWVHVNPWHAYKPTIHIAEV